MTLSIIVVLISYNVHNWCNILIVCLGKYLNF